MDKSCGIASFKSSQDKIRRLFQNLFIITLALFILCFILEIALRLHLYFRFDIPFLKRIDCKISDTLLGWKGKEVTGDVLTKKFKIFFLGDSFTDGCGVKTENIYFSIIKKNLDVEVFAYGGRGYGTLQEYLVIDRYIDRINPDLIVLQVCANDFINNTWALESTSYLNNNDILRPYYENGKIQYHFPNGTSLWKKYIIPYSRLAYFISKSVKRILARLAEREIIQTIEFEISRRQLDLEPFRESVLVTSELMDKLKKRCGEIPLIAFSVDDAEPYFSQFGLIFKNKDIEFIKDIPNIMHNVEEQGIELSLKNNHWNENCHKIIGEYLAQHIRSYMRE